MSKLRLVNQINGYNKIKREIRLMHKNNHILNFVEHASLRNYTTLHTLRNYTALRSTAVLRKNSATKYRVA